MIFFNRPHMTGRELEFIAEAHQRGHLAGDGAYTQRCNQWLERRLEVNRALLTHSCTAALEMSALLADVGPGDEVIMPSYTFVSTANAFVLRGATPVFVDIRADTLNLDENLVEAALSSRTRAIVPVHYAGVACAMQSLLEMANERKLMVIEDAAQGMMASWRGKPLGSLGDLGCVSFHETKNIISGEGGALLINDPELVDRAEIVREKGTNRSRFFRGQVDKYTWVDVGSSFLPGEIVAAFLAAQLDDAESITERRMAVWNRYHAELIDLEAAELLRRPIVPDDCVHNAHMYYILLRDVAERTRVIGALKELGVLTVFHYVPLHSSPAGRRFGRAMGDLPVTNDVSDRLLRLPLWIDGLEIDKVLTALRSVLVR